MEDAPSYRLDSAAATHVGEVRKHNEDSCLARPDLGLWVVADGMGGHQAGDLASQTIVRTLDSIQTPLSGGQLIGEVRQRLYDVNQHLLGEAQRRGPNTVIGSTVVALMISNGFFACLWAGDSRLYLRRGGALIQVTTDHSQVQEMVNAGLLQPDEAEGHPLSNVITRAVGTDPGLELDKVSDRVALDDLFLICSDGLTKMVPEDEILSLLNQVPVPQLPDALIDAARRRGGADNVTAVVVLVDAAVADDFGF